MVNIQNIIRAYETEVISWISEYYKELGYDAIIHENMRIAEKDSI